MLDGILLGYLEPDVAPIFAQALRSIKVKPDTTDELQKTVPMSLEIANRNAVWFTYSMSMSRCMSL